MIEVNANIYSSGSTRADERPVGRQTVQSWLNNPTIREALVEKYDESGLEVMKKNNALYSETFYRKLGAYLNEHDNKIDPSTLGTMLMGGSLEVEPDYDLTMRPYQGLSDMKPYDGLSDMKPYDGLADLIPNPGSNKGTLV